MKDKLYVKLHKILKRHEYELDKPIRAAFTQPYHGINASATIKLLRELPEEVYLPINKLISTLKTKNDIKIADFVIFCCCTYATKQYFWSCRNETLLNSFKISHVTLNKSLNKFAENWLKRQQGWNAKGIKREEELDAYRANLLKCGDDLKRAEYLKKQFSGHLQNIYEFWKKSEKINLNTKNRKEKLETYTEHVMSIPKGVVGNVKELFQFYTNADINPVAVQFTDRPDNPFKNSKKPIFAAPTKNFHIQRKVSKAVWNKKPYTEKLHTIKLMESRWSEDAPITGCGRYLLANETIFDCDSLFTQKFIESNVLPVTGTTLTTTSGNNGKHYHFTVQDVATKIAMKGIANKFKVYRLDLLQKNNFIVIAGSRDKNYRSYRYSTGNQIVNLTFNKAIELGKKLKAQPAVEKIIRLIDFQKSIDKIIKVWTPKTKCSANRAVQIFLKKFGMVSEGMRHNSLISACGYFHTYYPNSDLLEIMQKINTDCISPPLSQKDIQQMVNLNKRK